MPQLPPLPSHVLVPSLDAEFADLGLGPNQYQVCGQSLTAGGAVFLQVFTGAGYLWLAPNQYSLPLDPEPWLYDGFRATKGRAQSQARWATVWFEPRAGFEQDPTKYL